MNIFTKLYLKTSKRRFLKTFKPLGIKKKRKFLVSTPNSIVDFLKILPFLKELRKLGTIVILVPKKLESIYRHMKPNIFETIFYEEPSGIFTEEYKKLKKQLTDRHFHFLIELNRPANISLPYLTLTDKRICFYEKNNFPYYNIMFKNDLNPLNEFFNIKRSSPKSLFRFNLRESKKLLKQINKKRPLLFVNGKDKVSWNGDQIVVGKDISASDPNIYSILYGCDAYHGQHDAIYEFAKMFKTKIVE